MPRKADDDLSTTAYAVLGLLTIKSWTGYELTQQARRSLHHIWPKAESNLYAQPPRLVEAGLAHVETEFDGRRRRKRYSVTDAGRTALRRWLATRPAPPEIQLEAAVRLFFADLGAIDDAQQAVNALRDATIDHMSMGISTFESHADGTGPFPERDHISVLVGHLYYQIWMAMLNWCDLAEDELDRWAAVDNPGTRARTEELLAEALQHGHDALARTRERREAQSSRPTPSTCQSAIVDAT